MSETTGAQLPLVTNTSVNGHCPACGHESLHLAQSNVRCWRRECPNPAAATGILADGETEHIVQFEATSFTVRHPLRERLDDALMTCEVHDEIRALDGPPVEPGRYRAVPGDDGYTWEPA